MNVCGYEKRDDWSYNCQAVEGKKKVLSSCEGKQECNIPVNNNFFGNPCKGTFKYLRVYYHCQGGQYDVLRHGNVCTQCHTTKKKHSG